MTTNTRAKPSIGSKITTNHEKAVQSALASVRTLDEREAKKAMQKKARAPKQPHPADDLSFMSRKMPRGTGLAHWNVSPSGNYGADCDKGAELASEYLEYLGQHPTYGNATLLGQIVGDLLERHGARLSGLEVGFFTGVNRMAMGAAATLHRYASDPTPLRSGGEQSPTARIAPVLSEYKAASEAFDAIEAQYAEAGTLYDQNFNPVPHADLEEASRRLDAALQKLVNFACHTLDEVRARMDFVMNDPSADGIFDWHDGKFIKQLMCSMTTSGERP